MSVLNILIKGAWIHSVGIQNGHCCLNCLFKARKSYIFGRYLVILFSCDLELLTFQYSFAVHTNYVNASCAKLHLQLLGCG